MAKPKSTGSRAYPSLPGALLVSCLAGAALQVPMALGSSTVAKADAFSLIPHRAVYELSLEEADRDSGIETAGGVYVFEVSGSACAGWSTASDMALSLAGRSGNGMTTQSRYRSFEAADASVFTFQTETDGDPDTRRTGTAERDGAGLRMRVFAADATTESRSGEVLLPTQLTEAILTAALESQPLVFSSIFDGSHQGGLAQPVTALIGPAQAPTVVRPVAHRLNDLTAGTIGSDDLPAPTTGAGQALAEQSGQGGGAEPDFEAPDRAWPVTLSYFEPGESDATPSFVLSYLLDENGVSDSLLLAYESFSLRGDLIGFKPLPPERCPD